MEDLIIAVIIVTIVCIAICYIRKEKKKGVQCIGCPFAQNCTNHQKDNCNHQSLYNQYKNSK